MKIFGDNVLSLYICTQTIKGFLCLFVKFVLYRGPVLCEKHRIFFFFIRPVLISERFS